MMFSQFERILKEERAMIEERSFDEILRNLRIRLGLMQYKVAEYAKIDLRRLKTLETGTFRRDLRYEEIERLCAFYGLPEPILKKKGRRPCAYKEKKTRDSRGRR